ncbi:DUF6183 family protein [Nocardia sp. NPDC050412]|uniref:DUF6183 family protein n=1 Tax=Nocardia sp. NPDC050412 TaxID=3364320 RepID=UPI00379A2D28
MDAEIARIVRTLPKLSNISEVREVAEQRLADGDGEFLVELGVAIAEAYATETDPMWQYTGVFDHLLRMLIMTPGPNHVTGALRIIAASRPSKRRARYLASLLASSLSTEDAVAAFAEAGVAGAISEELRACLLHEIVLRGVVVSEHPRVAAWASSPQWSYHPLRWLPLSLTSLEEGFGLPQYGINCSSNPLPYDPSSGANITHRHGRFVPSARETTTPARAAAITTAVANWASESNGRSEVRTFDLDTPPDTDAIVALLATLDLDCLRGRRPTSSLSVESCLVDRVWSVLFSAASSGGAYNRGVYGAYGRLAAWQSLAALSGADELESAATVERQAISCEWYRFEADTRWFERVAWDIAFVALAPGRTSLSVLAATDTD